MPPGIGYPVPPVPPPAVAGLIEPAPVVGLPEPLPSEAAMPFDAVASPAPAVPSSVPPPVVSRGGRSGLSPDAIVGLAALAASIIGGQRTAGLASGVSRGLQATEARRLREEIERRQQNALDLQLQREQRISEQQEAEHRARGLSKLAEVEQDLAKAVPSFTDKAAYERYINFAGNVASQYAQAFRIRFDPNGLRAKFPFVAPSAKARARQAVQDILKNPLTKDQIDPRHKIRFDRDGDGVEELVPFGQLVDMAGFNVFRDENGAPIMGPAGPPEIGDKFKELLGAKLARFKSEKGRDPNPAEREALIRAAIKQGAEFARQERATNERELLRDELFGLLAGSDNPDAVPKSLIGRFGGAGLDYRAERARVIQALIKFGQSLMSAEDRRFADPSDVTPEAFIARARAALRAGAGAEAAPPPSAAPGVAPAPAPPVPATASAPRQSGKGDFVVLREKARRVLAAEAERRGLSPTAITEEQIQKFLANPQNRKRLESMP